jgi:aminopeptidase YwaD
MLSRAAGDDGPTVELVAFNGEDHWAAPGEVAWLKHRGGRLGDVRLAVNIDGIGFPDGAVHYSTSGRQH